MANDNYFTPRKYITSIRTVLREIDLDPFSSPLGNERIKAKKFYTIEENGFRLDWEGKIYANPPYSRGNLTKFAFFAESNFKEKRTQEMISLVPNFTSEKWFQRLIKVNKSRVCFTHHRIDFVTWENGKFVENANPESGNAFIYFGDNGDLFSYEFEKWGTILQKT